MKALSIQNKLIKHKIRTDGKKKVRFIINA